MQNFFEGLKSLIITVVASVATFTAPVSQIHTQNLPVNPSPAPLTLNNENYIYVKGNYSYFGMTVKYLFLVPKKGGNYSGSIEGTCTAQANGDYEGGNGGKISGNASGECNIFGMKYNGSTGYRGNLYPDSKKVSVEIDNSPVKGPFTLNYD